MRYAEVNEILMREKKQCGKDNEIQMNSLVLIFALQSERHNKKDKELQTENQSKTEKQTKNNNNNKKEKKMEKIFISAKV